MRREKHFEQLLEQHRQGLKSLDRLGADDAARLAAADMFSHLNAIEIPADMAQRIEARVRNRTATLQTERQNASPRHSFLRLPAYRPIMHRAWIVAISTAMLLLLAFVEVSHVAANSLPGSTFYPLKRFEQQIAVKLADNQNTRASLQLAQLQQALADLNQVVRERDSDAAIQEALASVTTITLASQQTSHALPAGSSREALIHSLTNALQEERQTLYQLLSQVDWEEQLAFTYQLGVLGEPIPSITQVTLVENADETLVFTVTGKNFTSGAHLVIQGSPHGVVLSNTSTTLRVQVHASDLSHHQESIIGVMNPDGTAAQIRLANMLDHDQRGPGDQGISAALLALPMRGLPSRGTVSILTRWDPNQ